MTALCSITTNKMFRNRYNNPAKAILLISNEKFLTRQMQSMQIPVTAKFNLNSISTGLFRIEKKVDIRIVDGIKRRIKSPTSGGLKLF